MDERRSPQSGDALILWDGRAFRVSAIEEGTRGWWFRAVALDGSCTLQGNFEIQWDSRVRAWRPAGAAVLESPDIPLPPSMRGAPTSKRKQLD